MESSKIRATFVSYFESKGHTFVPGWPVVPKGDPTLLFTNAGMNQFKDVLLGKEKRSYKRAANYQKCLRVSGKHNDLEEVGKDDYHHTFFEMLGNWSFGDYFKREAIEFAWELLTKVYGIDPDRLWATVYKDDDESERYWIELIGLPRERVLRFDERYNFWEMGDVGPCGPCSEIHYDYGAGFGCGSPNCKPNCGCGRFVEVWNLVFMEYFRDENGILHPLPQKNVDTGMGLERLTAILQGKTSNYETDLFLPIIEELENISGRSFAELSNKTPMRVIADHIRAISFSLADGIIPGNEGRGYVIRRLLRRASRYGMLLGLNEPFMFKLVEPLRNIMSNAYPELNQHKEEIQKIIAFEEEKFLQTLERGLLLFEEFAGKLEQDKKNILPGELVFKLYDTYGFPVDLTELIARERGFSVDLEGFETELEKQKELSRGAHKFVYTYDKGDWKFDKDFTGKSSEFVGYTEDSIDARLVGYKFEDGKYYVLLDRTPFWGETGGQVGDTGRIEAEGFELEVIDCKRDGERIVHIAKLIRGELAFGEVVASIDKGRRTNIARNHTATHLLHAALRSVLGEYVRQAGSLVEPERLRFDYTYFGQPDPEKLVLVESLVNEFILMDKPVRTYYMKYRKALDEGVIAIFEEKYGEDVRVVEIEGISRELCGGTHLSRTAQAGSFVIVKEESVASGVRRIEACTGISAYRYCKNLIETLSNVSRVLKCGLSEVDLRVSDMLEQNKKLKSELERLRKKQIVDDADKIIERGKIVNGTVIIVDTVELFNDAELLVYIDAIKVKVVSSCVVLFGKVDSRVIFVVYVSDDLVKKGIYANEILNDVVANVGGRGGGKCDLARGGTSLTKDFELGVEKIRNLLLEKFRIKE